ncbi:MAG: hypothetical protein C0467_23975 [Planctomycetaceae bacterium]|nr:hypothetical protein [Planctomycetaceae bacterium]
MPHEVSPEAKRRNTADLTPVKPTLAGRVIVGSVLAMAFSLAVRRLMIGTLIAAEMDPNVWRVSPTGELALQIIHALAVVFGAVIASAGQVKGSTTGVIVGLVCGALFMGYELLGGASSQNLSLYLHIPVLATLGLIGGLISAMIWAAPPKFILGLPGSGKLSSLQLSEVAEAQRIRPTAWARVLIGTTLMVVGVTVAEDARLFVQKYSGGLFHVNTRGEAEFITWQIAMLAGLAGAMIAGAETGAGARHGLYTGVLGALSIYGLCVQRGVAHIFPAMRFWLDKLAIPTEALNDPATAIGIIGSVILLGILGGWMGGALFQPLVPEHMRRGRRHGFD